MRTPFSRRGFTLVELLVVVSIIVLLLAILLPSLQRARFETRLVVCMTNLKQVALGSTVYANESGGYYPDDEEPGMRKQSYAPYPAPLADFIGGSVRYQDNPALRCPQLTAEGIGGRRQYQLYYTVSGSLKSGLTSINASHATPNEPNEAMPKVTSTRITEGNKYFGGGYWASTIVVSDIATTWSQYIGSGHVRTGERFKGGYGPLQQWWIPDSDATSNYAFQDGHVERHSFNNSNVRDKMMAASSRGAGDWDQYLLPRAAIQQQ